MGLKEWFASKSLAKGRANISATLEKLIPLADAAWERTERCMMAEYWPLPGDDSGVQTLQRKLLEDLTVWKGALSDQDAAELIGAKLAPAGVGAKMAVRHVVITEWHRLGKPTVSESEMEKILGSREEDKARQEQVRAYALRRLALEQAVKDVTGKSPDRPTYR